MSPPRGERIDVGGRCLRVVREGPENPRPLIVLEHGAFGCAADWGVVQARLAAKGLRSLAYDRAGLGHSDPGPNPRDGKALAADLAALLEAAGEPGPFVLVGHSMAGLMTRTFALAHPERVLGLVLVDAVTPEVLGLPQGARMVAAFGRGLRWVSTAARFGLMHPIALLSGNMIGLDGQAAVEKRRIYASAAHARGASAEVDNWAAISRQAAASELPPSLPVAVVTADSAKRSPVFKAIQTAPARGSRHGYVEHVTGANHASLLGRRFADPIVRGIEHVLAAAGR